MKIISTLILYALPNLCSFIGIQIFNFFEQVPLAPVLKTHRFEQAEWGIAASMGSDTGKIVHTLDQKNETDVRLLLDSAEQDILNLRYEEALQKINTAANIGTLQGETASYLLEIAFWYGEVGQLDLAKKSLNSAAHLVHKPAVVQHPFRESIKAFDPRTFNLLMERYYPVLVKVEGGFFDMGCDPSLGGCASDEERHRQELSSFKIAKHETSWWQFFLFCQATKRNYLRPSWGMVGNHPAVNISWFDAVMYCNWVNKQFGFDTVYIAENKRLGSWGDYYDVTWNASINKGFRLPTESEWEYAAKAGPYQSSFIYAGANDIELVAWYYGNSESRTQIIGTKKANTLGLFDMSGNVWEWCWDGYGEYAKEPVKDYRGPQDTSFRVLRGGGWYYSAENCSVTFRFRSSPGRQYADFGFRIIFFSTDSF